MKSNNKKNKIIEIVDARCYDYIVECVCMLANEEHFVKILFVS